MSSSVNVLIHASQFPDAVRCDLLESLRSRQVNHKFHYDSIKQTQKWLALHQVCSPSRHDAGCAAIYTRSFEAAAAKLPANRVHLIGLGCGGGQKDTRLLSLLKARGKEAFYSPCDVSSAMTLVARQTALAAIREENCFPVVCDLVSAEDLSDVFEKQTPSDATRIITFFGMIPNFEPQEILPKLAALVRPGDWLLFSANLAPGADYLSGIERILPQYDNALTRDWLMTFLRDLGLDSDDGELRFEITADQAGLGLKRIEARFHFVRKCLVRVDSEQFDFAPGDSIRLFFSYRHTARLAEKLLGAQGLNVIERWISGSEEEGVFLVGRA